MSRKKYLFVIILSLLFLPCSAFGFMFEGPFQIRNEFPVFLTMSQPYLDQAATEDSLSLSLSHSSVFMVKNSSQWSTQFDLELTSLNIRYKKNVPSLFEFGFDIPVLRAAGGFMDRPLDWYHRTFGFPDYGRSSRQHNDFLYVLKKNGKIVVLGDHDRTGIGDVRVTFKKKLIDDDRLVAAALVSLELPTGNARAGYGNGSPDTGITFLLDHDMSGQSRIYSNVGVVFPGDLKAYQTVNLKTFYHAGAGIEYLYQPDFSLLAQLMAQTSPFPKTGISDIDIVAMLLVLGGRYYTGIGSFEFSFAEDLNTGRAPDFTLNLTYKNRF